MQLMVTARFPERCASKFPGPETIDLQVDPGYSL